MLRSLYDLLAGLLVDFKDAIISGESNLAFMEMIIHLKVQYQVKMLMVIVQSLFPSSLIQASLSELNTSRRNGTSVMFAKIYVKIWINGTSVMCLQKVYI